MDELFSYWPLIFFIVAIFSRIMRNVNKDKNVIKKSKVDTKPLKEEQNNKNDFTFDKDDDVAVTTKEKKSNTKPKEKKQVKKIQVKKVSTTNNKALFRNKDDLIRGIIVKEVLDKPKFMD